jgi:cyclohexa-1,5-dienecarbonyl-CoA hydratase
VVVARNKPAGEAHRDVIRLYMNELMATEDANEGLQAFLDKRKPDWKHR